MKGTPVKRWPFASKSSPGTTYEVILWSTGNYSCNCKGWTLRKQEDGTRNCRHIDLVRGNKAGGGYTSRAITPHVTEVTETIKTVKRRKIVIE